MLKQVTRYLCEWCGKEFKTPDRHNCRWSPEAHNCLSCKHRGKRVDDDISEYGDKWYGFECPYFEDPCEAPCDFAKGAVSKEGNNCPHWELTDNYKGRSTFAQIEKEREGEQETLDDIEKMKRGYYTDNNPFKELNSPFPF